MSPKRKAPGAAEAESNVELERTDCGSYCTPDERFWVQRLWREEKGGRLIKARQWEITDLTGKFTFDGPVRTLDDAEESIAKVLHGDSSP